MRALRTQESWVGSDVIEIQRLNEELSEQKTELQEKIAKQDNEIEKLTHEIAELKHELDRLQRFLSDENSKGQRDFDHGRSRQDRQILKTFSKTQFFSFIETHSKIRIRNKLKDKKPYFEKIVEISTLKVCNTVQKSRNFSTTQISREISSGKALIKDSEFSFAKIGFTEILRSRKIFEFSQFCNAIYLLRLCNFD